jgi:hypothetical protein
MQIQELSSLCRVPLAFGATKYKEATITRQCMSAHIEHSHAAHADEQRSTPKMKEAPNTNKQIHIQKLPNCQFNTVRIIESTCND